MHKFFNKKRIFSLFILVFCAVLLVGCGKSESEKLWDDYVEAVNSQDLSAVAKTFYAEKINGADNAPYAKFLENNSSYFTNLSSVKTISYLEDIFCDFSSGNIVQSYYGAKVKVSINGSNECELYIYSYSDNNGTFFCTEFNLDANSKGNNPSSNWTNKVYYTNDDYKYFVNQNNEATYIEKVDNTKDVVVPASIGDSKVVEIGEYAFYKYNKILCFTIPTSKMKSIEIAEGVEIINKYAFYQCKKLKEIIIPESITLIDKMAFASCTNIEKLEIQARTQLTNNAPVASTSSKENGFKIVGAHNLQTGEILDLKIDDPLKGVKWSVDSSNVLSLVGNRVVALSAGQVEITATDINDPTNTAKVKISVSETPASLSIANDAFNRCTDLKEIYLHAYNPNSIKIVNGTNFTFNSTCKIYVPKGSLDMYKSHVLWSPYADNIIEMESSEEEAYLDKAKEVYNSNVESGAVLNGVYTYTNPINIDNILYTFNYTLGGVEKNLVVDVYTGSYIKNNATAKLFKVDDYSEVELFNLLSVGTSSFGNKTIEDHFNSTENAIKIEEYKKQAFDYAKPIILANKEKIEAELNEGVSEDNLKINLETALTYDNAQIVFEDMIIEVEYKDTVICFANVALSLKSKNVVIFNDDIIMIKDMNNGSQTFSSQSLDGTKAALYDGIVKLLLTGNKIA